MCVGTQFRVCIQVIGNDVVFILPQLTCAGMGLSTVRGTPHSMWICRGDEYGGQVCLLNMERTTKPRLVSSLTVCNSEITCIMYIPGGPSDQVDPVTPTHSQPESQSEMNMLDEFLNSVQKSQKPPTHEKGEVRRQTAPEFGSQDSISTLIATETAKSPSPPYSPSLTKRLTTSPLALHQVSSSPKLRRYESTPKATTTAVPQKHVRSHSDTSPLFAPKQYTRLPTHKEEIDSDTDGEDNTPSDGFLSPSEDDRMFTFSVRQVNSVTNPASEDVPRARSLSAPPDPTQVTGKKSGQKSVTIVESFEEISSSQEDQLPSRTNGDEANLKRPFSPLTLKPVCANGGNSSRQQVWLGTGEGM